MGSSILVYYCTCVRLWLKAEQSGPASKGNNQWVLSTQFDPSIHLVVNTLYITSFVWLHNSLVPGVHGRRKERLVSAICACAKFSQKSGKLCYFGILPHMEYAYPCYFSILPRNGNSQWQRRGILISLGLTHNLHRRRIQCPEAMDKWPCGDCFTFYSAMLPNDVLIENNKYGYVTMQNNRAMK